MYYFGFTWITAFVVLSLLHEIIIVEAADSYKL